MPIDLARMWTLTELARACALSRTSFSKHFRVIAGMPPFTYLTEWRMRHAEHELRRDGSSVVKVALSVGYNSEAAFSIAFKRVMGHSPRRNTHRSTKGLVSGSAPDDASLVTKPQTYAL